MEEQLTESVETFEIGQIFTEMYPPEAAMWCNNNNAYMEEIEPTTEEKVEKEKVADAEYDEEGNLIKEEAYEEKTVSVTVRRFQIKAIPEPTVEEIRELKLESLNNQFENVRNTAWIMSSLGFEADANEVANTNIDGLIKTVKATGQEPVYFCDKNNQYHALSLAELETLQLEVIQNGQNLYAQKWAYRDAINAATTVEEINAVDIQFTMMDFTA